MSPNYINFLVALSNVFGLIPVFYMIDKDIFISILMFTMTTASTLMHLSETKHGLKGIYPFNIWSKQFLNLDRGLSYVCGFVVLILSCSAWSIVPYWLIFYGVVGLICGFISERIDLGQIGFMIFHIVWHFIAYTGMCYLFYVVF